MNCKKKSSGNYSKDQLDAHANQLNPNNQSNKKAKDNRANQMNPNNGKK